MAGAIFSKESHFTATPRTSLTNREQGGSEGKGKGGKVVVTTHEGRELEYAALT